MSHNYCHGVGDSYNDILIQMYQKIALKGADVSYVEKEMQGAGSVV